MNNFKSLYSKNQVKNINLDSLFKNTNIPKLSNEEKHSLEETSQIKKCYTVLRKWIITPLLAAVVLTLPIIKFSGDI